MTSPRRPDRPQVPAGAAEDGLFAPERMNALTDGVFAIVLTLLVLELRLPEQDDSVLVLLRDDWRVFVAWFISFVLLARFWLVLHAITAGLRRYDVAALTLGFVVLGTVSVLPFSADVLGTERVSEPWSTVVFAGNVGLVSLAVGLLARHVSRAPRLAHAPRSVPGRYEQHHLYVLPLVTLAASLLAFAHPVLSVGLLVAEFVYFASGRPAGRHHPSP